MTLNHRLQKVTFLIPAGLPKERSSVKPVSRSPKDVQAEILELIEQYPVRTVLSCDVFPACGSRQFQHRDTQAYQKWKETALVIVLSKAGITPAVNGPTVWTGPRSRRRVTPSFRRTNDTFMLGFVERAGQFIQPVSFYNIMLPTLFETTLKLRK